MPPRRQHSPADIAEAAFAIAREEGLEGLSARTLAERLGCSTSPIYSTYATMQDLEDLVCEKSTRLMLEYQTQTRTGRPLLDMCLGYVIFAVEERRLFRDMFLNKVELSPHSQEMKELALDRLMREVLSQDPSLARQSDQVKRRAFEFLWTFTHGLAAQISIGAMGFDSLELVTARLRQAIDLILADVTR